ncbi:MAG TPA: PDZ domain-containing protein [Gemmatimonadota bacterium]|nr:PDZ domain-containing protein [Gemmatimonadota bacterium]
MRGGRILAALSVALLALAGASRAQETCAEARPLRGDPGIERYLCVGGACEIWVQLPDGLAHSFSTEPRIDAIDPESPAAGRLEVGDVLVAIDDRLITTSAAGRRLARLEPGVPVRLWVRRGGRDVRVELTPQPGCGPSGLSVRIPGAE